MSHCKQLFKSLLALSEPHEILSERLESIFDECFQLEEDTEEKFAFGYSEAIHTLESTIEEQKVIHEFHDTDNSKKVTLPPIINKTRNEETIESKATPRKDALKLSFSKKLSIRNKYFSESKSKLTYLQARKLHKEKQIPDFKKARTINPQNFDLLSNFLEFLATLKYSDKYFRSTLIKALQVIREHDIVGFEKLKIFIKINGLFGQILMNSNISQSSKQAIESLYIMNNSYELSAVQLIKKASENQIDGSSDQGKFQTSILLTYLPLIEFLSYQSRKYLTQLVFKKLCVEQAPKNVNLDIKIEATQQFDIIEVFKLPNRQLMLNILSNLIIRSDFKNYRNLLKLNTFDEFNEKPNLITNKQIRDVMGICLRAVSQFFESKKNFESLAIYIKLALKIFVCLGIEGSKTILGGRSMSEFIVYFVMKSFDSEHDRLTREQLKVFFQIFQDSLAYLLKQIEVQEQFNDPRLNILIQEDRQILLEAFDTLAVFTLQFDKQNKSLYEIACQMINDDQKVFPQSHREQQSVTIQPNLARRGSFAALNSIPEAQDLMGIENKQMFYQYLVDINLNPVVLQQIKNLINLELEKKHSNSASVRFLSGLVNYLNQINIERITGNDFKTLTDIYGMIIEFASTIIQNFMKQFDSAEKDPQIKMIQSSLQIFSQKFFLGFGIILKENNDHLGNYAAQSLDARFNVILGSYCKFVIQDVASIYLIQTKNDLVMQFGDIFHNFILDPLTKILKKEQYMTLFPQCAKILIDLFQQKSYQDLICEHEIKYKLFLTLQQILSYQQTEVNRESLQSYQSKNNNAFNEQKNFAMILDSLYELMKVMGAPKCFIGVQDNTSYDIKNSSEIIQLWTQILIFIQRKKENLEYIQPQLNKLASLSSPIIYDQDFNMKIKAMSHRFRDIEEILQDRQEQLKRYPQLLQSFQVVAEVKVPEESPKHKPSKYDLIERVKQAKIRKEASLKMKQESKEEEQKEDKIEIPEKEEPEPVQTQQQLTSNEIIFIAMFIVMTEARIKYYEQLSGKLEEINSNENEKRQMLKNVHTVQNFSEAILIVFNNYVIDHDYLMSKIDSVAKVIIVEYLESIQKLKEVNDQNIQLDKLFKQDLAFILKARCHLNIKISNIAGFMLKQYIEVNPLMLQDYQNFSLIHDCIQILSDSLTKEYESIARPVCLQTINEYVFISPDHERITLVLKNLIQYYSDLFIYNAIYDNDQLQSNFRKYLQFSDLQKFSVKMHQRLTQTFSLNKLKQTSQKNMLTLSYMLVNSPKQAIAEINHARQGDPIGTNSFFMTSVNDDIFQLGGIQNIKDCNSSISKITAFKLQIRQKVLDTIESNQSKQLNLDKLFQKISKIIMKIDLTSQLQFLQKSHSIDLILKELTKEQLKIQEQMFRDKISETQNKLKELRPFRIRPNSSFITRQESVRKSKHSTIKFEENRQQKSTSSKNSRPIYSEKKLLIFNLIAKLLQKIDKKQYIEAQSKKLLIVIQSILKQDNGHQTIQHIMYTLFSCMEPSVVGIIQQLIASQDPKINETLFRNIEKFSLKKFERKLTLKSTPTALKQCILTNEFKEELCHLQQNNLITHFFDELTLYDNLNQKQNLETTKYHSNFNQQYQSTKYLKYFHKLSELYFNIYTKFFISCNLKMRQSLTVKYTTILEENRKMLSDFAHKREFFQISLTSIKFGLIMAKFEKFNQREEKNKLYVEQRQNLIKVCFEFLISVCSLQKQLFSRRETISDLIDSIQLIEDVKYLIKNQSFQQPSFDLLELKQSVPDLNFYLISQGQYCGQFKHFCQLINKSEQQLLISIKQRYQFNHNNIDLNSLLMDQLNQIKFMLCANNFYQKQMLDLPHKQIFTVQVQGLVQKMQNLLYHYPKFIQIVCQTYNSEVFQQFLGSIEQKKIVKVYWKSELALEILMRQKVKNQKMLTYWRNVNVSRMISFLGFKYSGAHFLHSIALKPFYAGSSKITIFYLSQFFQSLRWDTGFQLQKLLIKKSQTKPSIAHNVIWFCRVESFIDAQPQRKVPLPLIENLDKKSSSLMKLIFSKMSQIEEDYFHTETDFLEKITSISGVLKPSQSKDEKKAIIREKLIQYNKEIPPNVYLPTNQRCRIVGIVTSSGQPMQSAARVPILVSFEVQEYEGPDCDPLLNRDNMHNKSSDISPLKQDHKLQNALKNLSQTLLKINAISLDRKFGELKVQEELREQLTQMQLQNYCNINENLMEMLNQDNMQQQILKYYQEEIQQLKNQPKLLRKQKAETIATMNVMPTLKLKMSQYLFETKQNPLNEVEQVEPEKGLSSMFKKLTIFNKESQKNQLPPLPEKKRSESISETEMNERADESLNVSVKNASEISDSESLYEKKSPKHLRKFSVQRKSSKSFGRSSSRLLVKKTSLIVEKSNHAYKPSIFSQFPGRIGNNGINLVLQFEQMLLQSQYRSSILNPNLESEAPQVFSLNEQQGPIRDANKPIKIVSCIFKVNDDLRQDILALQFIKLFQKIFKKCDLELFVAPYKCISNRTGEEQLLGGIIEVVPNSNSRDQIGKAFEIDLYNYFLKKYGNESSNAYMQARFNFIKSLAAYSVVSYILQIKDRHNGNILIDDFGNLVHIDFGFVFDWSPGKDMRFESANFKMTKEFIKILGGNDKAEPYQLFVQKTIQGYLAVREHYRELMNLVELMIYSGFPCFKQISLQTLQQRFRMEGDQACQNQFEAAHHMRSIMEDAHDKWTTFAYDFIQYKQNKIVF